MSNLFELKLEDSPFPQAMDLFYEQLAALVSSPSRQKVALVSNLTTYPMRKTTRLWDKYVTRSFADRTIEAGSPEQTSDIFLGPASYDDQFSSQYLVLLNRAMAGIDLQLPQEKRNEIELSRRRVSETNGQIDKLYKDILDGWNDFKKQYFPGKMDDDLIMERV